MQYILSEEEYRKLTNNRINALEARRQLTSLENKLQTLCTKVANEMPIMFWDNTKPQPWGCILSKDCEWYCDECPVKDICPSDAKTFSK